MTTGLIAGIVSLLGILGTIVVWYFKTRYSVPIRERQDLEKIRKKNLELRRISDEIVDEIHKQVKMPPGKRNHDKLNSLIVEQRRVRDELEVLENAV